ncbi:MAG: hypothetical protein HWD62_08935 [Cyclobacteriaceae bacterium]|nr:MAG: hypothetical protein HWD62_08935 [Cyclobacteriaceae bacterium]
MAPNVAGITVNGYTGTIDINGFNLTTTGTNSFVSGTINNGGAAAAVTLNTTGTTTFSGTTFGAAINGSTGRIFFNGSTFNGNVSVSKTDNSNDNSNGNNVFNGITTITNLSGGHVLLGYTNRDQFNGPATFNNNGSYRFYFAYNHGGQTTTFTDLTLNTNKSGGADGWSFLQMRVTIQVSPFPEHSPSIVMAHYKAITGSYKARVLRQPMALFPLILPIAIQQQPFKWGLMVPPPTMET